VSRKLTQTMSNLFGAKDDITARASHENFPVASRFLPRDIRSRLMAIYAFARLTDDIGDEAEGDRVALLDWLDDELTLASEGRAIHPVFQRLTPVMQDLNLNLQPFRSLIEANRVDQRVTRYSTFDDLVDYCMLSAAPIGHLVLAVFKLSSTQRIEWSDQVCIALQLVEHLQDIGEDARRGRIYLPIEDLNEFRCSEEDLLRPSASVALRDLIAMESRRTRALLTAGSPLASSLPMRARFAVSGFVAGGVAAVESIEREHYDVLSVHCRPRKLDVATQLARKFTKATLQKSAA
jgi:squalene synthase HpnC